MLLKCPRCNNQFETDAEGKEYVNCPECSAKLRLRSKTGTTAGDPAQPKSNAEGAPETKAQPIVPPVPPSMEKDQTLAPGFKLGGFEIKRVLGRGGMATVYKALQLSLNRHVAVKVLAARFSNNPVFTERFDREAGALATLNHPNIVNIIDKGVEQGRYYFFVMELVEGITLDQLLNSVELNEKHYVHLISEISKAMTYVHSKGIIHRDIKPSNIMVSREGIVKVSDFGIAHIAEGDMPAERFGKNATVGTANYMAPEQAANPGAVDVRADVYSLGVTYYKMFTKQLPVGEWKPPSRLNGNLPRSLDPILARAMQPNPDDRYPSVKEFSDELLGVFSPGGASKGTADSAALGASSLAPGNVGAFSFGMSLNLPRPGGGEGTEASHSSLFMPAVSASDTGSGLMSYEDRVAMKMSAAASEAEERERAFKRKVRVWIISGVVTAVLLGTMLFYFFAVINN